MTRYRQELGIGDEPVVLYAGNIGFSQSLELIVAAARQLPDVTFLVNGDGSMRSELEAAAAGVANVRFGDFQPADRLGELLATGDLHVVPLRRGLAERQRAVEDLLDPRRRAARARGHRSRDGDPAPARRVGGWRERRRPTTPQRFTAAVAELVADRQRARRDGRGGASLGGVSGLTGGGRHRVRGLDRRIARWLVGRNWPKCRR